MNHSWTPRWTPLRFHAEQDRLWNDTHRFKIIPAGRRSGKTELAKRRLVEHLFRRTWHGQPGRYFAAAPTRDQAKRIFWDDLQALLKPEWKATVSASDLRIVTRSRSQLWVIGLDKPQRMEGIAWDGGVIDEYADCKPGTFDAHIRPALADRRGWLWMIGVPDVEGPAQVEYEKLHELARSGADMEWAAFHWPSADILPVDEVESARRRMDARLFRQEMLGEFILAGGRAFPEFSVAGHVSNEAVYNPARPICWSLDFNINPMCSGVMQHQQGQIKVIHEMALVDCSTAGAVAAFLSQAKQRQWSLAGLTVYGDASGNARDSTSGTSDWLIVRNRLNEAGVEPLLRVPRANPPIKDTLNALNAKLRGADGVVRMVIHPSCHVLIDNLRSALWPCPMQLREHHALAWLRYFVASQFPIRLEAKKSGEYRVGFA